MKSENISTPISFRAETASKAATDGQAKDVQQFSNAMDSASEKVNREVHREAQRDEQQNTETPPRTTESQPGQAMVQRQNNGQSEPLSTERKNTDVTVGNVEGAENDSTIASTLKTQEPHGVSIVDYLMSLSQITTAPTNDAIAQPEQKPAVSELSTAAEQTAALLSFLDFQTKQPTPPSQLPDLENSIGTYATANPISQMPSTTTNALSSTRYLGQPIPSSNSLQDESSNLIFEAPSQTPLLSRNALENNLTLPLVDVPTMSTTTTNITSPDVSQPLEAPLFTPFQTLQTFSQTQPESLQNMSNSSGSIAMGNGDEFSQSTTTFLVKAAANGSHTAVLKVSPEHLGPLRADIAMNELPDGTKSMSLTLTLSNEQAMEMAKESLGKLQSELALAGISCPTIQLKMDAPISATNQTGTSEGSLHSSSNPSSGQQSHRDDSRSKRISYEDQATALSPTEKNMTISLFDRTA